MTAQIPLYISGGEFAQLQQVDFGDTESQLLDGLGSTRGSIPYRGAAGWAIQPPGTNGLALVSNGPSADPSYQLLKESALSITNNTTGNVSTSAHGFAPQLSNDASQFLNGQGNWVTPSGVAASYVSQSFSNQTSINVVHNFGAYPVTQILISSTVSIPYSITHNSLNDFIVTFTTSQSGTILATIGAPPLSQLTTTSGNYTVSANDEIIKVTAASVTITLITAVGRPGKKYIIDNASTGNISVNTTSSQTIQNQLIQTIPASSSMSIYSDGAGWRIF